MRTVRVLAVAAGLLTAAALPMTAAAAAPPELVISPGSVAYRMADGAVVSVAITYTCARTTGYTFGSVSLARVDDPDHPIAYSVDGPSGYLWCNGRQHTKKLVVAGEVSFQIGSALLATAGIYTCDEAEEHCHGLSSRGRVTVVPATFADPLNTPVAAKGRLLPDGDVEIYTPTRSVTFFIIYQSRAGATTTMSGFLSSTARPVRTTPSPFPARRGVAYFVSDRAACSDFCRDVPWQGLVRIE